MATPYVGPVKIFMWSWCCSDSAFVASIYAFASLTQNVLATLPLFVFSLLLITMSFSLTS